MARRDIAVTVPEHFDSLDELINYHLGVHPGMELRDIYKLLHQSVFGPEHLGKGVSEEAIQKEILAGDRESAELLLEPISVDTTACRINLRAARRRNIAPGVIASVVQESAGKFSRDRELLVSMWTEIGGSLGRLKSRFGEREFEELNRYLKEEGYPPLHHSDAYRENNLPAYRVLLKGELDRVMQDLPACDQSPAGS